MRGCSSTRHVDSGSGAIGIIHWANRQWAVALLRTSVSAICPQHASAYFGRREEILKRKEEQKGSTICRHFQYNLGPAPN